MATGLNLNGLSREELIEKKASLERERADIREQLGDRDDKSPEWVDKAEEAYGIKGRQIHQINNLLAAMRQEATRRG